LTTRIHRVLAVAEVHGATDALELLLDRVGPTVDAVAVVGNLTEPWSKPETYRAIFKTLGAADVSTFWVPGRDDAPLHEYLSESHAMEIAYPLLRGVHGTISLGPGETLFAGMGGEILDAPSTLRAEEYLVRYPGWEVEYRLKVIRELEARDQVFLFATPPAHERIGLAGSTVLAELVKTHNPAVVVVGGETRVEGVLGKSLVVAPGRLDRGRYAVADVQHGSVELGRLELLGLTR
jgi:Icc-related predicted phosphoesterase